LLVLQGGVKHIEEHVERVADASKPEIVSLPSINQVRRPLVRSPPSARQSELRLTRARALARPQIDLHPFMTREDVVSTCRKHGIHMEVRAGCEGSPVDLRDAPP
jgi:hypothetical protein